MIMCPGKIRHTTYTVHRSSQALPSQGKMVDEGERDVCRSCRVAPLPPGLVAEAELLQVIGNTQARFSESLNLLGRPARSVFP